MNSIPDNAIVRISIGHYPPDKEEIVEEKLNTIFKDKIKPAVKRLNGNIHYFVAMDKEKKSLTNVSIWTSKEAAHQMAEMEEMKEMGRDFVKMGVMFSEITNHEMLWQLPENK
jgi:hypothetical protein